LSPLDAATIDTIGTTTVLNTDNPGNQYIGNGILQVAANGADVKVELGTSSGAPNTQFYMTAGGLITIDSGFTLQNGRWAKGFWINGSIPNRADMMVNGTLDIWDGNPVHMNALNGAGAVTIGFGGAGTRQLKMSNDFMGGLARLGFPSWDA
jgi:hypothetical protein